MPLKRDQHGVNDWSGDSEIALKIGVCGWSTVDFGIGVDKGQVLALLYGKSWRRIGDRHSAVNMIKCHRNHSGDDREYKISG